MSKKTIDEHRTAKQRKAEINKLNKSLKRGRDIIAELNRRKSELEEEEYEQDRA